MSANTPPKPHTEGMEWTNTETGIKYQFSGGAWRAVSSSASEEVAEAIDNIDLEKVLGNGNVATKGATFGEAVSVGWDAFNTLPSHAVPLSIYEDGQGDQNQLIEDNASDIDLIQGQVEELEQLLPSYVSKAGDRMTGQLSFTNSNGVFIRFEDSLNSFLSVVKKESEDTTILELAENTNFKIVTKVSGSRSQTFKVYADGSVLLVNLKDPNTLDDDTCAATKGYVDSKIPDISPQEIFDVRAKKDVLCTADSGLSWSTAVSGEVRGIYTSGTVRNANRYVGNWNYAIVVHKDDYEIHGDFSSENSSNRGVLEIFRHNGEASIFKAVVKRTYTNGDALIFLLEHNLFGFGDVLNESASNNGVGVGKKCRFYFYTL